MNRSSRRRGPLLVLLVAAVALLTGCSGSSGPTADPPGTADVVRVGSANFPENRLLAEIYASGLERRGVRVERRFSVGSREAYLPALRDGSIDLVPEYTGNLLLFLKPDATAATPDQVYQELQDELPSPVRLLARADAQDKDAVVVTRAFAVKNRLQTIDDLARRCATVVFGAPEEFRQRPYGLPGLARTYSCTFRDFVPLDAGGPQTVAALRDGRVQAADMFTTDPAILQNDLVVLQDPRSNFAAQNVVPLIDSAKTDDPRVAVLDQISAQLDTPTLTALNRRLAGPDNPDLAQVARDWLTSVGIT